MINLYFGVQLILLIFFGGATLYIFIFAVAGLFHRRRLYPEPGRMRRFAVLIPGYKEDAVIVEVARKALQQEYPSDKFDVVVIADSFLPETLEVLRTLPVKLIEVSFAKSTKAKALNKAMKRLGNIYDLALVLDADNLMEPGLLKKMNAAFEDGFVAVQGHRTAKNMNTPLAILDALSEEINNHIFRKGHRVLGLSSAIIGSGMAFQYDYFRKMMSTVNAVGGFDKEIELKMLKGRGKIAYLDDALIYDEKVQKAEVFHNQRRRWLSAQLHYFRKDFFSALKELALKGNIDYFDKVIQFIQPPRILLLGTLLISGIVFLLLNRIAGDNLYFQAAWISLMGMCISALACSIPLSFYRPDTLKALKSLPSGMWLMFRSLLKIRGANNEFIHTRHGTENENV